MHIRHRGDLNPCGQSPMDFETISLTTRTQCPRYQFGNMHRNWQRELQANCAGIQNKKVRPGSTSFFHFRMIFEEILAIALLNCVSMLMLETYCLHRAVRLSNACFDIANSVCIFPTLHPFAKKNASTVCGCHNSCSSPTDAIEICMFRMCTIRREATRAFVVQLQIASLANGRSWAQVPAGAHPFWN